MNATMRAFGYSEATAGALTGGILGSVYGIMTMMTTGAIVTLLAVLLVRFGA